MRFIFQATTRKVRGRETTARWKTLTEEEATAMAPGTATLTAQEAKAIAARTAATLTAEGAIPARGSTALLFTGMVSPSLFNRGFSEIVCECSGISTTKMVRHNNQPNNQMQSHGDVHARRGVLSSVSEINRR